MQSADSKVIRQQTFAELFLGMEKMPEKEHFLYEKDLKGNWRSLSLEAFLHETKCISLGLREIGVSTKDKVGIISPSLPRWVIADLSTMLMRMINVPLYSNLAEDNFLFQVDLTKMKAIFVGGEAAWKIVKKHQKMFEVIIAMDEPPEGVSALRWKEVYEIGQKKIDADPDYFYKLLSEVQPSDESTIMFTSGTTGKSKGVVHTHRSLASINTVGVYEWSSQNDTYLNILPYAHIFGRIINYIGLYNTITTYYLNDLFALKNAIKEVKPTILIFVPRILEKIYSGITGNIEGSYGLKKLIGQQAIKLASTENPTFIQKLFYPLFDFLVFNKIRELFGGRVRFIISGGAQLDPSILRFFINLGISIHEGWGMTEMTIGCCNHLYKQKIGTVGQPLFPDVEFKLAEDGELFYRNQSNMKEYYQEPAETKAVLDEDGWLRTGDCGIIDEEGYIKIIRRKKELFKTSTGEYVAPIPLENALRRHPLVDMAMVVAEDRKFTSCLLFPDFDVLETWKMAADKTWMSNEDFLKDRSIKRSIQTFIEEMNTHFNPWEQVKAFELIYQKPTIEGGELTSTMKLRRDFVLAKYKNLIDQIYER